jgi:predicted PurR-regulated permease PerM
MKPLQTYQKMYIRNFVIMLSLCILSAMPVSLLFFELGIPAIDGLSIFISYLDQIILHEVNDIAEPLKSLTSSNSTYDTKQYENTINAALDDGYEFQDSLLSFFMVFILGLVALIIFPIIIIVGIIIKFMDRYFPISIKVLKEKYQDIEHFDLQTCIDRMTELRDHSCLLDKFICESVIYQLRKKQS